jgi:hypothetical protein
MSGLVMGQVWSLDLTKGQQAVLLSLADHAHDDGTRVFPSVSLTAWKTGYQRRHVQRLIRELRDLGVLIEVAPATARLPTEYRIDLAAGKQKPPHRGGDAQDTRGDISDTEGRHSRQRGASPTSPEPSVETSTEPPEEVSQLAAMLEAKVNEVAETPGRKRVNQGWLGAIDKLIRIDRRTPEQVAFVINWLGGPSEAGQFWGPNIMSGPTLRKRFDTLAAKIRAEKSATRPTREPRFKGERLDPQPGDPNW